MSRKRTSECNPVVFGGEGVAGGGTGDVGSKNGFTPVYLKCGVTDVEKEIDYLRGSVWIANRLCRLIPFLPGRRIAIHIALQPDTAYPLAGFFD